MKLKPETFDETLKLLVMLGAAISFVWSILVWSEARRVESTKPFLERQLSLYVKASRAAAVISTSTNEGEVDQAKIVFWRLFWGELALVENSDVESAMINFGNALNASSDQHLLKLLSLDLAKACGKSLDKSWGINAWSDPDQASAKKLN